MLHYKLMKPFTKMFSQKALSWVSEFISPSQKTRKKKQNENKQTKLIIIYN